MKTLTSPIETPMFRRILDDAIANEKAKLIAHHQSLVKEVTGVTRPFTLKPDITLKEKAGMVLSERQDKQKDLSLPMSTLKAKATPTQPQEAAKAYLHERRPSDEEVIAQEKQAQPLHLAI